MKPVFRNDAIFILTIALSAAFFFLYVIGSDGSAESLQVTFEDNIEDVEGISYKEIEAPLKIKNTDDQDHNISVSTDHPIGANTKDTINIYPQVALGSKGQGMYFEFELDAGKTRDLNILIIVNDSAFADTYTFDILVTNLDDRNEKYPLTATVTILEYNLIDIRLADKEDEKTIRPGKRTQYYVKITNMGNIYNEKVGIDVDYPGNNLSIVVDPEYAILEPVSTAMHEDDSLQIYAVTVEAIEDTGKGTFELEFNIDTPDYGDPPGGHTYISVSVIVSTGSGDDQQNIDDLGEESSGFPIAVFGGGLLVVIVVMGIIAKIFVLDKMEDEDYEESEWGGEEPAWGAEEPSFEPTASAGDFEVPLTASPPPRRAPQQQPRPSTAPRGGPRPSPQPRSAQRPASKPGPGPRPSGPAHVKCPKCHTGMKVSNPKRPLTISCPKCSIKFTLKGKPGAAPAPRPKQAPRPAPRPAAKPHAGGPAHVKCPKCHTGMKISNPKRPLTISCPKCSTKFTLKGKPGAAPAVKPKPRPGPRPATKPAAKPHGGGPAHVKCPKCHTGMKISNPKRPLTISCPKCSTKFTIKGKPGAAPATKPGGTSKPAPGKGSGKPAASISCPKCSTKFRVSNPKRPLSVACPKCKVRLNLK